MHQREQVVGHRHIEMPTAACPVALAECQEDIDHRRVRPAGDICDQRGRDHRTRRRPHGLRKQPRLGDVVQVMASRAAPGPVLAVARNRAVDDSWIDARDGVVTQPEPRHDARAKLLDEDIRAGEQRLQLLAIVRSLQIRTRRFFPRLSSARDGMSSYARAFDLDDLRARFASSSVASGPGSNVEKSRTRQPSSGLTALPSGAQRAFFHQDLARQCGTLRRRRECRRRPRPG